MTFNTVRYVVDVSSDPDLAHLAGTPVVIRDDEWIENKAPADGWTGRLAGVPGTLRRNAASDLEFVIASAPSIPPPPSNWRMLAIRLRSIANRIGAGEARLTACEARLSACESRLSAAEAAITALQNPIPSP